MTTITTLLFALSCCTTPPIVQWGGPHCDSEQTHLELITDTASLTEAWNRTHGGSSAGQPFVDFQQCRLVLTLRGRATGVQRVRATDIEVADQELRLTIDAGSGAIDEGQASEETTAWGLFVVPLQPESVRVGYEERPENGGEAEWMTITVLGPNATHSGSGRPQANRADDRRGPRVDFEPDLSLLQPRRSTDRDQDIKGSPHAALYHRDNKQLLFIGAAHSRDIEKSPTHRMVRAAMEGFHPQVVIVEGLNTSEGTQPERFLTSVRRRIKTGQLGESPYAAILGDDLGAIVIGGEPDPRATTDIVREAGFSDDDLIGFLVARNLTTPARPGPGASNEDNRIRRALSTLKQRFDVDSSMDTDGFKAWYLDRVGEAFDPRRVKREVSPQLVDDPSILRQIAILAMKAREYNLVELEARMLEEHDRVMVVYGSGHLRWERPLLKKMLGDPVLVTNDLTAEMFDPMNEHLEKLRQPWTRELQTAPDIFISHGYDPKWPDAMKAGIDVARDYLGNYGPLQVYIIGQEDDELSDPAHVEEIAQAYCLIHNAGSERPIEDCLAEDGRVIAQKAVDGDTEAYLTMAMDSDPPRAEIVLINPHGFGGDDMPTRSIHEYTHVYQKAFAFTPTWMMEGGAELLACHLGEKHGWGERDQTMEWYARHLEEAEDLRYTIRDMEEIETAGPLIARWHRELAYDAGAWAVAYLIDHTPSRSIRTYFRGYFPLVDRMGWEKALCEITDFTSVDAFYEGFEVFMNQPIEERLDLLDRLKA